MRDPSPRPEPPQVHAIGAWVAGRYEIARLLGRGGMGAVYLVDDVRDGRRVALKEACSHRTPEDARAAIAREFELLAGLSHPNLPEVHDLAAAPACWFTMEHINGVHLAEANLTGPELVDATVQLCRALDHVHGHGLVHMDLKPTNILVGRTSGRLVVKLVDFGVATKPSRGPVPGYTRGFVAPEVARGDAFDGRADLYSLGMTLLSLRVSELAADDATVRVGPDGADDHLPRATDHLPPELAAMVLRLTKRDPAERPATARQVIEALVGPDGVEVAPSPLARLEEPLRRLLWAAAIVGPRIAAGVLDAALGNPSQSGLDALVAHGLVAADTRGYRFVDTATRDQALADARASGTWVALHGRLADGAERAGAAPALVARLALESADPARAVPFLAAVTEDGGLAVEVRLLLASLAAGRAMPSPRDRDLIPQLRLRREGDVWRISGDTPDLCVRDSRGLRYLAILLDRPGADVHVETLVTLATRDAPSTEAGNAERLRQSVTKRLRDAVRKIGEHDAALGAYLHRSIRTGVSCAYIPVPMIGRTAQRA